MLKLACSLFFIFLSDERLNELNIQFIRVICIYIQPCHSDLKGDMWFWLLDSLMDSFGFVAIHCRNLCYGDQGER